MTTSSNTTLEAPRRPDPSGRAGRGDPRSRGWQAAALAGVGLVVVAVATAVGEASGISDAARVTAALGPGPGTAATVLRLVLLLAGVLTAGAGAAGALLGTPRPALRAMVWAGAATVVVAVEISHLSGTVTPTGAALQIVAALAVAVLAASRWGVAPAVLLTALLALVLGSARVGAAFVLDAVFTVAAVTLAGTTVAALVGSRSAAPDTRLRPVAVAAGVVAAAAGLAQLLVSGPAAAVDLTGTAYGLAALAGSVLPVVVSLLWVLTGRPSGRLRARELHRFAAVGIAAGTTAVALLAALPTPAPAATPGRPLLRALDVAGNRLAVLVTPMRPGPNLVRVSGTGFPSDGAATAPAAPPATPHRHDMGAMDGASASPTSLTVSAGGPAVPVSARRGVSGGWAAVDIPAGTTSLTVTSGGLRRALPVDVGDVAETPTDQAAFAGPDGPECADAQLGALVAASSTVDDAGPEAGCPTDALSAADAASLRTMVRFLGTHGTRAAMLVSDGSPRARAAADLVRESAQQESVQITAEPAADDALLVVSGWAAAAQALDDAGARAATAPTHLGGTFLAPWLLTGGVITRSPSSVLPLLFNPQETAPQQYAAALAAAFPGAAPSASGYLAWARRTHAPTDDRPTLYGAAPVDVPMGGMDMADMGHGANGADWFPGGTVVPVTPPLDPA